MLLFHWFASYVLRRRTTAIGASSHPQTINKTLRESVRDSLTQLWPLRGTMYLDYAELNLLIEFFPVVSPVF